ncbi:LysR family transcriptional regulator [Enterococcus faecalis]
MKLQQLEYFMAVSKYASFTLASQKLHTSQPYLSTQLKELERELGASLILRDKKHCRLSPAGEVVAKRTEMIFALIKEAQEEINELVTQGSTTTIRIGTNLIDIDKAFGEVLLLFNQSYPYVSIDFKYYYDLETALETDLIDIGIGIFLDTSIPLEKELIYTESYLLCVNKNHPLAHADSVTIDEIRSLPFAVYSDQVYEKKVFKRWERKINWENRQIVIELPSLHLVLDMVQREKACSILPYSLTDELNRRNLVGIPLEDSPERAIYLVQNNHHGHCEAHRYLFEQLRYLF